MFWKTAKCGKSETGFLKVGFVAIGSARTGLRIVPALPVAKSTLIAGVYALREAEKPPFSFQGNTVTPFSYLVLGLLGSLPRLPLP